MDMHSGGGQKDVFTKCFIEATEDLAPAIFNNMLGRNPDHITCSCCGEDYSYWEYEDGFDEEDFKYYNSEEDYGGFWHGWDSNLVIFIPVEAWHAFYDQEDSVHTDI